MSEADVERLGHAQWGVAAALAIGGSGVVVGSPLLVAAATLPLWFVAAATLGTRPQTAVSVDRHVSIGDVDRPASRVGSAVEDGHGATGPSGDPGDTVTVAVTVRNVGEEPLPDLRIVDGVPAALPVVAGSPRRCVTLDAGAETTFEYELELRRGENAFGDGSVRTRDLTGTVAATRPVAVSGDRTVTCAPAVDGVPLGGGTNDYAGEVPTDEGGSGVEFFAVRDYEPGDPIRSIDWRRYAGTRELATVQYRAERATRIVCVVDARRSENVTPPDSRLPAVELSAGAARRTFDTLVGAGHPTGLVTLSPSGLSHVPPGTDATTRERATDLLDDVVATDEGAWLWTWRDDELPTEELARSLPGEALVYLFSSVVDDGPVDVVGRLRARGYSVRVVSPDLTAGSDRLGTRLEAVARDTRLARMRAAGARVVDWDLDRPLGLVLREAVGEVSRR